MTPEEIQAKFNEFQNQIDDLTYRLSRKTGLGSADVKGSNPSRLNRITTAVSRFINTDGATIAVDWSKSNVQSVMLAGTGRTVTWANQRDGQLLYFIIIQDSSGSRTITTWPSTVIWAGGSAPTLTATANRADLIVFVRVDGQNKEYGFSVNKNFAPCCVIKGTLVSTPNGDIPIENLKLGDFVYTFASDGSLGIWPVIQTFAPTKKKALLRVGFDNGIFLIATPNHAFYDAKTKTFNELGSLKEGTSVVYKDRNQLLVVHIQSIEPVVAPEQFDVYDISVLTDNNFFANGIVAHNMPACPS